MKILLVNDDGIFAPGINALASVLKEEHEVTMVAPESERSGFSQSLTYLRPITVKEVRVNGNEDVKAYAVSGTPVDCVKIGTLYVLKEKPDLVISGINNGFNIGTDIYYSGTVGAATEAAMFGLKAIAVSQYRLKGNDYSFAAEYIASFIKTADLTSLPEKTLLNINFPIDPEQGINGTVLTRQGVMEYNEYYEILEDNGEGITCRLRGNLDLNPPEGTDFHALLNRYVSVTALKYDRTDASCDDIVKRMITNG